MTEEGYMRCPLPVVRDEPEDDPSGEWERSPRLGVCGGVVFVTLHGSATPFDYPAVPGDIWDCVDGLPEQSVWKLECELGHVLLVADVEDRSVPYSAELARAAFDSLRELSRSESV